jgi:PhzF family phenazine biosynthesis protein
VVVQECGVGLVRIRRDAGRLAFEAPPLRRRGPLDDDDLDRLVRGLGLRREEIVAHSHCDNGPPWQAVLLRSTRQVLDLRVDRALLEGRFVGVVAPGRPGDAGVGDFEVRAFFPGSGGVAEDPVTGSLNAALAQWLMSTGVAPDRYVASQGAALGRSGRVHLERDSSGSTWVGGDSVTCIDGHVTL